MYTKGKWEYVEDNDNTERDNLLAADIGGSIQVDDNIIARIWSDVPEGNYKANAARIVQCVNSHDELVAALEDCEPLIRTMRGYNQLHAIILKALANAKGEQK